jgi:hypothetical protein
MISVSERDAEKIAIRDPDPLTYESRVLGLWRAREADEKFRIDLRAKSGIDSVVSFNLSQDGGDSTTPFSLRIRPFVQPPETWTNLNIHISEIEKEPKVRTLGSSSASAHPFVEYHSILRIQSGRPTLLTSLPTLDGKDQLFAIVTATIISDTTASATDGK